MLPFTRTAIHMLDASATPTIVPIMRLRPSRRSPSTSSGGHAR